MTIKSNAELLAELLADIADIKQSIEDRLNAVIIGDYPIDDFLSLGLQLMIRDAGEIAVMEALIKFRNAGMGEDILSYIERLKFRHIYTYHYL